MALYDDVLADLAKPGKRIFNYRKKQSYPVRKMRSVVTGRVSQEMTSVSGKRGAKSCYMGLRTATRYTISDELMAYLVPKFMDMKIPELTEAIIDARLPDKNMWVEWNEQTRYDLMQETSEHYGVPAEWYEWKTDSDVSDNLGFLLSATDVQDRHDWIAVPFHYWRNTENAQTHAKLFVPPVSFLIHPELDGPLTERLDFDPDADKWLIGKPTDGEIRVEEAECDFHVGVSGFGFSLGDAKKPRARGKNPLLEEPHITPEEREALCDSPIEFLPHNVHGNINDVIQLMAGISGRQNIAAEWSDQQGASNWVGMSCDKMAGDARWLVLLLATLNYDWIIREETTPAPSTRRLPSKRRPAYDSHITLSIDLPKARGVTMFPTPYVEGASRRLHGVRGHWRYYRKTGKRVWVRPHKRGDAKRGVITKDYILDAA